VKAICRTEPVIVAAAPGHTASISHHVANLPVTILETPLDDCWARDIAPLFTLTTDGRIVAVNFKFNSWGGKFTPYDDDAEFGRRIAAALGHATLHPPLVLEGGAVSVDGAGTALLVEGTVLNDNRNPQWTRADVEELFDTYLGIDTVIWLPYGLLGDTDTDGHVDNVALFVGPSTVLCQVAPSSVHPDNHRLSQNRRILSRSRTSSGSQLDLIEVPWLPATPLDSARPASYVNVYLANHQALIPVVGARSDDQACSLLAEALPGKTVVPTPAKALFYAGGGPHCMTMQIPATQRIGVPDD
jgi:agmatine deiminase